MHITEHLPRKFFLIYISKILVNAGIGMFLIFILLTLWNTYNSTLLASVPFVLMSAIPSFLSPIIGTHVDRYSKRKIGLISLALSIFFLLPLIFIHLTFLVVVVFAVLIFFESYYGVNYNVSVRNIVEEDKLIYATNLWVVSIGISYVLAYVVGAYIYTYMGFAAILILVILLYLISLIF